MRIHMTIAEGYSTDRDEIQSELEIQAKKVMRSLYFYVLMYLQYYR